MRYYGDTHLTPMVVRTASRGAVRAWHGASYLTFALFLVALVTRDVWLWSVTTYLWHESPRAPCPLPWVIASRGFAAACCDVYPSSWHSWRSIKGWHGAHAGEHGDLDFHSTPIRNMSIVYVPAFDLGRFVDRLSALPPSARVTVVAGGEDIGLPREAFGLGRRDLAHFSMRMRMQQFLADRRLVHLFVQNYDLVGCNEYSGCADAGPSARLARKVSPIPIGVDLHTRSEKLAAEGVVLSAVACHQQAELEDIRVTLAPLRQRPSTVFAPFSCKSRTPTRMRACEALRGCGVGYGEVATTWTRQEMWRAVGRHAFVAAPVGHGVDSHRV